MSRLSTRQEVAIELAFSAGEPLGRTDVGREDERGFVIALAEIESDRIAREFAALERWSAWLAGRLKVEDDLDRVRLCEDCELIGWHVQPPEGL